MLDAWEIVTPLVSGAALAAAVLLGRRRVRRRRRARPASALGPGCGGLGG